MADTTSRRRFLAAGVAVAGGLVASSDIKRAFAAAVRTAKPMLTQDTLKSLFGGPQGADFTKSLMTGTDPVAVLQQYFSLTTRQVQSLRAIPAAQVNEFRQQGLQRGGIANAPKLQIVVQECNSSSRSPSLATSLGAGGLISITVKNVAM